ncbi:hypothetical protein ACFOLJ_26865 [Rugamonas sp. CCM 8940]|uniref:hypothetical protein n=1 Tax=Rugamonas sp. CCM 8940 TaxID=2765359 RepID=UPI00360C19F7
MNEFASEEDVGTFELKKIWNSFRLPFQQNGFDEPGFRFAWTIDRKNKVFLMRMLSGRQELSNRITFALWIDGTLLTAVLDLGAESTENVKKGTGQSVWNLLRLEIPPNTSLSCDDIETLLKEALVAYGYDGIWQSIPHYAVKFSF